MATLRQFGTEPFDIGPADALPVTAPADRWVVLVRDGGPVSAVAPGATLADGARPPGILVAAADLELTAALESDAFQQLTEVSALVLIEPHAGPDGRPGIAGVMSGQLLTQAILRGTTRGIYGPVLPGVPSIPLITRSCGFAAGGVTCTTVMSFPSRPYPMPDCPNGRGMAAHRFAW
jgi:hypothetical protein